MYSSRRSSSRHLDLSNTRFHCSGALDEFDDVAEQGGGEQWQTAAASTSAPAAQVQAAAVNSERLLRDPGKKPKFNPLGRKPRKQKAPNVPPPELNDLGDVPHNEIEDASKELCAMLENMMKGAWTRVFHLLVVHLFALLSPLNTHTP